MKSKKCVIIGFIEVRYCHTMKKAKGVARFAIYDKMNTDASYIKQNERLYNKFICNLNKQNFSYQITYNEGSEENLNFDYIAHESVII